MDDFDADITYILAHLEDGETVPLAAATLMAAQRTGRFGGYTPVPWPEGGASVNHDYDVLDNLRLLGGEYLSLLKQVAAVMRDLVNQRAFKCSGNPTGACCSLARGTLAADAAALFDAMQAVNVAEQAVKDAIPNGDMVGALAALAAAINAVNAVLATVRTHLASVLACVEEG